MCKCSSNNYKDVELSVINKSNNALPDYAHYGDSGMDIRANLNMSKKELDAYQEGHRRAYDFYEGGYSIISDGIIKRIDEPTLWLYPLQRVVVPTGLFVEIPIGYEIQLRSKSGRTLKEGLVVANSPATIDSPHKGEIKLIMYNLDSINAVKIEHGEKIAQMVLAKVEFGIWKLTEELSHSTRGENGFGSTGIK